MQSTLSDWERQVPGCPHETRKNRPGAVHQTAYKSIKSSQIRQFNRINISAELCQCRTPGNRGEGLIAIRTKSTKTAGCIHCIHRDKKIVSGSMPALQSGRKSRGYRAEYPVNPTASGSTTVPRCLVPAVLLPSITNIPFLERCHQSRLSMPTYK
jgi:hypothetical protein